MSELTVDDVLSHLANNSAIAESYVVVRELNLWVDYGESRPFELAVKIQKSEVVPGNPYHWSTNQLVHTPSQATPYVTSNNWAETEEDAIDDALRKTLLFIHQAIEEGHEFSSTWLVPNPNY